MVNVREKQNSQGLFGKDLHTRTTTETRLIINYRLTFTIDADEGITCLGTFYIHGLISVTGECKRWLRIRQKPPSDFLCGANITKITASLKELDNERKSTFLPTRLIDLGCHDRPSTFGRLVTKQEAYKEQCTFPMYVALSYPWGSPEQAARQTKTTQENIYDRMKSIDLQAVSQVIQDAATVCKMLGVRYLWVDALCIIQGDLQDWERESTEMGNIFRNAYLTIGAAAIDSCHESFLSQNVDALDIPFQSRIEPKAKGTYRLIAGNNGDGKRLCILHASNFTDVISGPWAARGWVFQEVAMSTRLLMFGRTMVTLEILEDGNEEIPICFNVFQKEISPQSWRDLVGEYSGQELTFQKDTLPAISGLARLFAERLGDQYLAGVWRSDLFISLFWYHPPPPYLERRDFSALINTIPSRPFIAPSWSWAAESSNTEFGTRGFHPTHSVYESKLECNVIDAQCIVEGLDPFGIVKSGYIVLSAKVLRLQKGEFMFTPTPGWQNGHYDWYLDGETRVMQTFLDGHPGRNDPDIHRVLFLLLGSCNDYGMEAFRKIRKDGAPNGERCAYGLVLYPARGANTFYRVGLFNSQVRNHAPGGGLKFCDSWKMEEITIV